MIISSAALAATVTNAATQLGATLPAAYTAAVTEAKDLARRSGELGTDPGALYHVALVALREGRDPTTDPAVQRLATEQTLADGIRVAGAAMASDLVSQAITDHSDGIVTALGKSVAADLETLATASAMFHFADINGADLTRLRRENALSQWADATTAAERVDQALTGARAVLAATHTDYGPDADALMLAPEATADQVAAASGGRGRPGAWQIARTGAALQLATPTELAGAVARFNAAELARDIAADADELATGTARASSTRTAAHVVGA